MVLLLRSPSAPFNNSFHLQIEWAGTAIPFADIPAVPPPCVLLSFEVVNSGPTVFQLECQVSDGACKGRLISLRLLADSFLSCRCRTLLQLESNNHRASLVKAVCVPLLVRCFSLWPLKKQQCASANAQVPFATC